jgi:tRNA A-37 threonylcarbamoyl transferase component Bud32
MKGKKIVVNPDFANLEEDIKVLPYKFNFFGTVIYQKRNIVKRMQMQDTVVVVKRFKRPNPVQRIVYTYFKPSKAERGFKYAERFENLGIHTPQSVAYIEIKRGRLLRDSYYVATNFEGTTLDKMADAGELSDEVVGALARLLVKMHELGIEHGDPNLGNFMYAKGATGKEQFAVIDTNRSKFGRELSKRKSINNLKRLTHNRELLQRIVEQYASLRHWNSEKTTARVIKKLNKFEHNIKVRHTLKRIFLLRFLKKSN